MKKVYVVRDQDRNIIHIASTEEGAKEVTQLANDGRHESMEVYEYFEAPVDRRDNLRSNFVDFLREPDEELVYFVEEDAFIWYRMFIRFEDAWKTLRTMSQYKFAIRASSDEEAYDIWSKSRRDQPPT
jgi:hypothetical protein